MGKGHRVAAPSHDQVDLFDGAAVRRQVAASEAVFHLATRIPRPERMHEPGAWAENDRLRAEVSRRLVDAALESSVELYVQPTVALVYPPDVAADETTPIEKVEAHLRSALVAEAEANRFTAAGRRGIFLRLGLLYGPGTGVEQPDRRAGPTVHVQDAAEALGAALDAPAGIYNVTDDGGLVSARRFMSATGWRPRHGIRAAAVPIAPSAGFEPAHPAPEAGTGGFPGVSSSAHEGTKVLVRATFCVSASDRC